MQGFFAESHMEMFGMCLSVSNEKQNTFIFIPLAYLFTFIYFCTMLISHCMFFSIHFPGTSLAVFFIWWIRVLL